MAGERTKPASLRVEGGALAVPGADANGVRAYKGIPFAAPPVGDLRWRPPAPVVPWTGVRDTSAFGANAMQGVVFNDIDPLTPGVSEDCLYLNVWTPASPPDDRLPVFFWIHGGGFVVGHGAEPRYDGGKLAARGMVVVTANHRLGALGFMAHPDLTAESPEGASGNYGLLDQLAALAWVKRNIAAFGGDPDCITIAGESAGSISVCALMASPLAAGLFQRAIGQSGALMPPPVTSRDLTRATAEGLGVAFAAKLGAKSLAAMRDVPAERIVDAQKESRWWPIVDGHFLAEPPAAIFAAGRQNDVTLLAGWNRDEGFNFDVSLGTSAPFAEIVRQRVGERAEDVLALYPAADKQAERQAARDLGGDLTIIQPTWAWLEAQRKTGKAEVYRYRFDRSPQRAGRLVRRAARCQCRRLPCCRDRVRVRHARCVRVALHRCRPPDGRDDVGLLDQLHQDRRSQRGGLAKVAFLSLGRRPGDAPRRKSRGATGRQSSPVRGACPLTRSSAPFLCPIEPPIVRVGWAIQARNTADEGP